MKTLEWMIAHIAFFSPTKSVDQLLTISPRYNEQKKTGHLSMSEPSFIFIAYNKFP